MNRVLYFIAFSHFSVDVNMGSLPALLPFLVFYYGMDYTQIAGLLFASACISAFIQPLLGYMSDKKSRPWLIGLGILIEGICFAIMGFSYNYWLLFALVAMMGVGSAIFHPEAAKLINQLSGKKKASGMSIFSIGGNGGYGFGPLLLVFLISIFGIHGTAFYAVLAILVGIPMLLYMPRVSKYAQALAARESFSNKIHGISSGKNDWNSFGKLTFVITFRAVITSSISAFLPLFCITVLGTTEAMGSATLSIVSISGIVATLIGGRVADKIGYVKTVRIACMALIPLIALIALNRNIYVLLASLIPLSLLLQGTYSPFVVLGQTYLSKNVGFASGITMGLVVSIGGILLPLLGWYADTYGIEAVMFLLVIISAVCGVSTFLLKNPQKN